MPDDLTANQLKNGVGILRAVRARNMPKKVGVICISTVLVESGMRILASANVPESQKYPHDLLDWTDDGLGHDHASMGMWQQQTGCAWTTDGCGRGMTQSTMMTPNGWGKPSVLMNAEKSTELFLNRLEDHDWQNMQTWEAAQAVQGSAYADGSNYRGQTDRAIRIVNLLWDEAATVTDKIKAGVMFTIVQDESTGAVYAFAAGFWAHITSNAQLAVVASSALCTNGKGVRAKQTKTYRISHQAIGHLKAFALSGEAA